MVKFVWFKVKYFGKKNKSGEYKKVKRTGSSHVWLYFGKIIRTATEEIQP